MKKLFTIGATLLFCILVTAQENKVQKELKSYMAISVGPSFAAGDFASKSLNNEDAGYAKTGFNINLSYGIKFVKNAGLEIAGIYGFHGVDGSLAQGTGVNIDHYQYYGLMAGPVFNTGEDNVEFSIRFLGGVVNANSPKMVFGNETLVGEDWVGTFVWTAGADVSYDFTKKAFLLLKADYVQMRPEFTVTALGERVKAVQHMSMVNVNAGIGIRF